MLNLLALLLLSGPLLDGEMTSLEKKKTGLEKLTEKEKKNLQEWIDKRYAKQNEPIAKASPKKVAAPTILENLSNGKYIRLSDNTLWEIYAGDTPITQGWITPAEIAITPSGQRDFPNKLTNSLTGSSVLARPASKVPPELAPQSLPEPPAAETKPNASAQSKKSSTK